MPPLKELATTRTTTVPGKLVNSIDEYTSLLGELSDQEVVLFRGQAEDDPLVPKIGRLKLAHATIDVERRMMEAFKRQAHTYLRFRPESEWDWLAIAQHHGMATRMLDWTLNPLIALWFAVGAMLKKPKKNSVVWAFTTREKDFSTTSDDPYSGTRTKVFQPSHIADRIRVQGGFFTVHKYMEDEKRFIPFENIQQYNRQLTKIEITAAAVLEMRKRLNFYGVNEASIFPELDSLCRHIEWSQVLEHSSRELRSLLG